ncbi:MAG: toprim domain-containing protein, partial [Candidatus Margulisiibacteriota bacterium]
GYTGLKGSSNLYSELSRTFSDQVLLDSGLFIQTSNGLIERFTDRLMFPIFDLQNRLIAFGGRTLGNDPAKYINSPETPIYHKSQHLYGLVHVKPFIKEADSLVIVEGYMDAISLFEAGVKNVAASLGTSFTIQQAKLAERFSNRLFLCFDSDEAGRKAVERSLEVLGHTHCEVKVIDLLGQKDPDDFIRTYGKGGFDEQKRVAFPLIKYMIFAAAKRYGEDAARLPIEDKLRIIKEIRAFLTEQDDLIRSEYIGLIATLLSLDIELIKSKFYDYSLFNMKLKHLPTLQKKQDKYMKLEQEVFSILLNDPDLRVAHLSEFSLDDFESTMHQEIFRFLGDHMQEPVD